MELVFVRHGESAANVLQKDNGGFYCGRFDCELTEHGYEQAKSLKGCEAVTGADVLFSSPLKRARETASCFADREILIDERITERSLGVFENKFRADLEKTDEYRRYFEDGRFSGFRNSFTVSVPGGESYGDVIKRVTPFLEELICGNYKKAVIVSHYAAIRCMLKIVKGLSEEETVKTKVIQCEPITVEYRRI